MSESKSYDEKDKAVLEGTICAGTVDSLIDLLKKFSESGHGKKKVRMNGWGSDEGLGPFVVTRLRFDGDIYLEVDYEY